MLTLAFVSRLRSDDVVYAIAPEGYPVAAWLYRVVGFNLHYTLAGGVPAPFLKGPDGEVFTLTTLALRDFYETPYDAKAARDAQP